MKWNADHLPDDVEQLKQLLQQQQLEIEKYAQLSQQVQDQLVREKQQHNKTQTRLAAIEEQLRLLLHKRFGHSSEKVSPDQLGFFDEAEAMANDEVNQEENPASAPESSVTIAAHQRKTSGRKPLPDFLPRVEVIHDLSEAEKICPHDGAKLQQIGTETSEQLDVIPAKIQVIQHIRYKYACPCCDQTIKQASLPAQPIPKSQASPGLLAHIAVSKYLDALPLYRQAAMWQRAEIDFDRTTLANWMIKVGALLIPIINLMQDKLLANPLIHCDETTVQVLKEPDKPVTSKSYLWVRVAGPPGQRIHLFDYDPSRSSQVPKRLLEGYHGILLTDGYEGYRSVIESQALVSAGCWAHARRKFDECLKAQAKTAKQKSGKAQQGLAFIQMLYRVERSMQDKPLIDDEKVAIRQTQSKPILTKMRAWLDKSLPQVPPKSLLGKALHYLNNQWPKLIIFLDYGGVPLDNNVAENAIRPFVLGRKNWLFSTSQAGVKASAAIYTVVQTAKVNGLEPYTYLKNVLTEIPNAQTVCDIEKLLPFKSEQLAD